MTTIHDVLADLAEDAPEVMPDPGLWVRGSRWHRVRRGGSAVIVLAACVLLLAVGLVAWRESAPPVTPATTGEAAALPSRVHRPSSWLPGTDEEGPLGQLSTVITAGRSSWSGVSAGLVGVSASAGEYRFLDLPDAAQEVSGEVALAPDGRRLAYWVTGDTEGSPWTGSGDSVVGVAVYDTLTGDVRRHLVPTDHGLNPDVLAFADDSRLLLEYSQWATGDDGPIEERSLARSADGLLVWDTSTDAAPTHVGTGKDYDGEFAGVAGDGRFVVNRYDNPESEYAVVDLDSPRRALAFDVVGNLATPPLVDAAGRRVAAIWGGPQATAQTMPNELLSGRRTREPVSLRHVPDSDGTSQLESWIDRNHVAVRHLDESDGHADLRTVDVRTGEVTVLTTLSSGDMVFATDLYAEPPRDFPAPPTPMDPRLVSGLVGGVVLAAGLTLLLWRRRGVA